MTESTVCDRIDCNHYPLTNGNVSSIRVVLCRQVVGNKSPLMVDPLTGLQNFKSY